MFVVAQNPDAEKSPDDFLRRHRGQPLYAYQVVQSVENELPMALRRYYERFGKFPDWVVFRPCSASTSIHASGLCVLPDGKRIPYQTTSRLPQGLILFPL